MMKHAEDCGLVSSGLKCTCTPMPILFTAEDVQKAFFAGFELGVEAEEYYQQTGNMGNMGEDFEIWINEENKK